MKKGYLIFGLIFIVVYGFGFGITYYDSHRAKTEVIDLSIERDSYPESTHLPRSIPDCPIDLRVGQMVSLCGACDLLYEVPIRAPLEVRHRIGEIPGDRQAMVMMEPYYLDDIDMWFVKVDTGNDIFGWVPISCINGGGY